MGVMIGLLAYMCYRHERFWGEANRGNGSKMSFSDWAGYKRSGVRPESAYTWAIGR